MLSTQFLPNSEDNIITNAVMYGFEESVRASKFPMSVDTNKCDYAVTKTVLNLGGAEPGTGHDNFLNGIVVQFDLTFTIKAWTEMQRYHFVDFVSSQSTMHRITRFDPDEACIDFVTEEAKDLLRQLTDQYNADPTPDNYLRALYNTPVGLKLTARMTTNYRQLKTIYRQRKGHRLKEWRTFCKWVETLPYAKELIVGEK